MAWVRIHDGAMGNLKILRLSNSAFRLWVHGLCYCQTHLTDGLVPLEALKQLGAKRLDVQMLNTVLVEGKWPLWETIEGFGFKVHDYLLWNDCREKVMERQDEAKRRKAEYDARKKAERAAKLAAQERVPNGARNALPDAFGTAPLTKPNQTKEEQEQECAVVRPNGNGNGHAPDLPDGWLDDLSTRYQAIYAKVKHGAPFHFTWRRDEDPMYALMQHYGQNIPRLEKMLEIFFRMDPREVKNIPGTPAQFNAAASEIDARLRQAGQ